VTLTIKTIWKLVGTYGNRIYAWNGVFVIST